MKTLLFIVVSLFSGITLFAQEPIKDEDLKKSEEIEIRLIIIEDHSRNIQVSPIECYLFSRILYFSFTENLGNSTIIVCGANNNEVKNIDSTDDYLEFNLSNYDNGEYYIEIITENGDVYIGHFNLQ
ncbi:MAG: DUF3244 domain-containing protein [Bacteroidaceae bacterium]|nr:DUF3244 domain-containing protein [Bacteroidaceae bacterium]